jgi:hypothetical protein
LFESDFYNTTPVSSHDWITTKLATLLRNLVKFRTEHRLPEATMIIDLLKDLLQATPKRRDIIDSLKRERGFHFQIKAHLPSRQRSQWKPINPQASTAFQRERFSRRPPQNNHGSDDDKKRKNPSNNLPIRTRSSTYGLEDKLLRDKNLIQDRDKYKDHRRKGETSGRQKTNSSSKANKSDLVYEMKRFQERAKSEITKSTEKAIDEVTRMCKICKCDPGCHVQRLQDSQSQVLLEMAQLGRKSNDISRLKGKLNEKISLLEGKLNEEKKNIALKIPEPRKRDVFARESQSPSKKRPLSTSSTIPALDTPQSEDPPSD